MYKCCISFHFKTGYSGFDGSHDGMVFCAEIMVGFQNKDTLKMNFPLTHLATLVLKTDPRNPEGETIEQDDLKWPAILLSIGDEVTLKFAERDDYDA